MAFSFAWLTLNPDVLWLQRKLHINFKQHLSCLHNAIDSFDTWIMDYNMIQDWTQKTANFWTNTDRKYRCHQALLLCYGRNCSGLEPPGDNGFVYSGAVVWVLHDQTHITMPQAVHHIRRWLYRIGRRWPSCVLFRTMLNIGFLPRTWVSVT